MLTLAACNFKIKKEIILSLSFTEKNSIEYRSLCILFGRCTLNFFHIDICILLFCYHHFML